MENIPRKNKTLKNAIVILVGMLVIVSALLINILFQLTIIQVVVLFWILTTLFGIWGILITDPKVHTNPIQIVEKEVIREVPVDREVVIDRPVISEKEVFIDRPVYIDRPVTVEKEVIREVPIEVEKIVYKTIKPVHTNLNIPKYEFVGSTETKKYHKRGCKFSKLIKNKYKLHSNYVSTFENKNFEACKACITKNKKN